jgi:hypothetical protein
VQVAFGTIALTGTNAREWAGRITYGGGPRIQTAAPVRARSARQLSRGNWQQEISFTVQREHATLAACEVYKFQHQQALALAGNQSLVLRGPIKATYLNAALRSVKASSIGVRSVMEYTFVGGIAT